MSGDRGARMIAGCGDVQKFVHPFLDGEFDVDDSAAMEQHLAVCAPCREMVAFESSFKATLKARLRRPATPAGLRGKVLAGLDQADARGEGPARPLWRRGAAFGATFAAAAAVTVLVGTMVRGGTERSPLATDAVRAHEKNLPLEVGPEAVSDWMVGKVSVPVHPPNVQNASFQGARLSHLSSRDAAQLYYRSGNTPITVYIFEAEGLPLGGAERRELDGREYFVDGAHGYSVVFVRDGAVGYAFTAAMDPDEMVDLVAAAFR